MEKRQRGQDQWIRRLHEPTALTPSFIDDHGAEKLRSDIGATKKSSQLESKVDERFDASDLDEVKLRRKRSLA